MSDQSNLLVDSISSPTNHKDRSNQINDIRLILEWAGEKLLSLPNETLGPKKIRSYWPHVQRHNHDLNLSPTSHQIDLIDQIYLLTNHIPDSIPRRLVHARSLITPLNHRYLFTWSKLGRTLNSDRRQVKIVHNIGLNFIRIKIIEDEINRLKSEINK